MTSDWETSLVSIQFFYYYLKKLLCVITLEVEIIKGEESHSSSAPLHCVLPPQFL